MAVAVEETREILESVVTKNADLPEDHELRFGDEFASAILQAVEALDLLDEALAEATRLGEELEGTRNAISSQERDVARLDLAGNILVRRLNNIAYELEAAKAELG